MRRSIRLAAIAVCLCLVNVALAEIVTPDKDEEISVYCECLMAFSGCESALLAAAAGKPTHSWYQKNYLKAGVKADLNAACYRKRDVKSQGDGLCCTVAKDEGKTTRNLFKGTRK